MSVSAASPTVVSNRPSCSRAARRTTAVGSRTNEELRSSRRSASLGSRYRSRRNVCWRRRTPSPSTMWTPNSSTLSLGCRPSDRVEHGGTRARQQVVVVVELHDPLAGGDLHGTVHVLDQRQRGPVPDVAVPRGPAVQDPSHHVTGGAVVGPVGDGHLDLLGHGRDRLDDRAQRPLEQAGTVAGRHRDRQRGRLHVVHPSPVAGRAATVRAWRALTALRRTRLGRPRRSPRRGPPRWPWSPSWSGPSWPALVWHATRLNPVDAWVMGWQERADSHADAGRRRSSPRTLPAGVMLMTMVASAAVAWLAGRRDARGPRPHGGPRRPGGRGAAQGPRASHMER